MKQPVPEENTPREPVEERLAILFDEKPYQEFVGWLDQELDRLVARWQHLAAPNAARIGRCSIR